MTGQMLADLAMNRYDTVCSVFFQSPVRMREADFAGPILYLPLNLYVRADDQRFDNDRNAANKPETKFAVIDGDISAVASNEDFPLATKVSLPQMSNGSDLFMMLTSKKVDAVEIDPDTYAAFAAANPNMVKQAMDKPIRVEAMGFPIPANEPAFKSMLNVTLDYLHDNGFIEKAIRRYEGRMNPVLIAKHYRE
jgi:ABC-type amino acid transport substrate-binding protein